ncbi:membrane protein [Persicobacter diffluens]|uniref:Membrane protein n=2 Tax=Persicobacter diffluens TaxID=981 RepID=A0AAN5AMV4_9BACT|nr:membrane protein [Persicobacter diffluens]
MALDHSRDFFHYQAFLHSPTDPTLSNLATFFTRWLTHLCAPAFSLLAGISIFLSQQKKGKYHSSVFLLKRGIWLIFIEFTLVNFAWFFNPTFSYWAFLVIWVLGISMIIMAGLIHLPVKIMWFLSLGTLIFHNILDGLPEPTHLGAALWHHKFFQTLPGGDKILVGYPIIPWFAVMSLGYCIGTFYKADFPPAKRKIILYRMGTGALLGFLVIRGLNGYGNVQHWKWHESLKVSMMDFLNLEKYPPSLSYLLVTLGMIFILLALFENRSFPIFETFGKVPFLFYVLHLYFIHLLALIAASLSGFGWKSMILSSWVNDNKALEGYGYSLFAVYLVTFIVVLALYPICRKFHQYKKNYPDKKWLSYW